MKVLHILTDTNIGGAGKCVLALADWASGNKYNGCAEVILPVGSALKPEFELRSIPVREAERINDKSFDARAIKSIKQIIKSVRPDIVHTHAALSGRIAARQCGQVKIVSTRHSMFDLTPGDISLRRKFTTRVINGLFSDAIIAVSPAVEENLTALGAPRGKIRMIFNGVPRAEVYEWDRRAEIRKAYGLTQNDFVVSIIARLSEEKDHNTVLDAAKKIMDLDRSVKFIIAGEGPMESRLKKRVQSEEIRNVIFTGFVKEIVNIENITDLQINASVGTEATSMALISGMSLGIPAVASDFGGNPYVVADGVNGLLFPRRNSQAMANAITRIRNNRELYDKMSFEALETYETRFTLNSMGSQTFELYEELLRGVKN
ncbi:MAG: glycosyltransferase family 4 protein [Clostridiales bacterium]|nr:glycosyltransferase family 4 protein [Clostridiales bacterium]